MIAHFQDAILSLSKWGFFWFYLLFSIYFAFQVKKCVVECIDKHHLAVSIAECFCFITIPISIYHTVTHLLNFEKPRLQANICRIIWMVPIFSIESLLSICFFQWQFYFQSAREIYEAYVIYCFMRYLLHFLGDGKTLSDRLMLKPASFGHHQPPFCWLPPWQMGDEFLRNCKAGVFQYVVLRSILTLIAVILHPLGWYEDGDYNVRGTYLWMTLINCTSQTWALYSLFLFYQSSHSELLSKKPFWKFFCIKMVIFFSWWQALSLGILMHYGHINSGHGHSAQEVANLIQDLLICMEMLLAAISFFNAFPVQELIAHPFQIFPSLFQMKSEIKENVESMLVLSSPLTVILHGKNVTAGNSKFGITQNPFFNLALNPLHLGFSKNKYQSDGNFCGDYDSKDDPIMNSEQEFFGSIKCCSLGSSSSGSCNSQVGLEVCNITGTLTHDPGAALIPPTVCSSPIPSTVLATSSSHIQEPRIRRGSDAYDCYQNLNTSVDYIPEPYFVRNSKYYHQYSNQSGNSSPTTGADSDGDYDNGTYSNSSSSHHYHHRLSSKVLLQSSGNSPLRALMVAFAPDELLIDLRDLSVYFIDNCMVGPLQSVRKRIKGSTGHS